LGTCVGHVHPGKERITSIKEKRQDTIWEGYPERYAPNQMGKINRDNEEIYWTGARWGRLFLRLASWEDSTLQKKKIKERVSF